MANIVTKEDRLLIAKAAEQRLKSSKKENFAKKSRIDRNESPDMFDSSSEDEIEDMWNGSPLSSLPCLSPENLNVPPVVVSPSHAIYVKLPLKEMEIPQPYPDSYRDIWNSKYVRMPNSPESLYPKKTVSGGSNVVKRWTVICQAFDNEINSTDELCKAILSYNQRYEERWKFEGLQLLLEEEFSEEESEYFFSVILPKIIKLALELPNIVTKPIILLTKKCTRSITLSQKQIACLLANAFLCTFPRRNAKGSQTEYASYPDINFNRLFLHKEQRALEKLKCIIHYFKEVTSKDPDGVVTFSRQHVASEEMPKFEASPNPLSKLHIHSKGLIEETNGLLQVDFANKFIGGGVLGLGCVQEEIRFVLCPDLLVSRLFTEVLDRHEALIITGVEQYSNYKGYASTFEWLSPHLDVTLRDPFQRKLCQVVAIDALHFSRNPDQQYRPNLVMRELEKAYAGFRVLDGSLGNVVAVATGNWGCGAFKGDPYLKGLIQLAAASAAGRDLAYFTFGNKKLKENLSDMHVFLLKHAVTVGELVMVLRQYGLREGVNGNDLFKYIYHNIGAYNSDTDSEEGEKKQIQQEEPAAKANSQRETLKLAGKSITDYFKAVPNKNYGNKSSTSSSSCKQTSLTEDKILQALNECDKLVEGKLEFRDKVLKSDGRLNCASSEDKTENADSARKSSKLSMHPSSSDSHPGGSLFNWLDKIDKSLT